MKKSFQRALSLSIIAPVAVAVVAVPTTPIFAKEAPKKEFVNSSYVKSVSKHSVKMGTKTYKISPSVRDIFNPTNAKALQNAKVKFIANEKGEITSVNYLELRENNSTFNLGLANISSEMRVVGTNVTVIANAKVTLPKVVIMKTANSTVLDANVQELRIQSANNKVTAKKHLHQVNVYHNGKVTLHSIYKIKELSVTRANPTVYLGSSNVHSVNVPNPLSFYDVFAYGDKVRNQMDLINGKPVVAAGEFNLTVLHTNDTHAALDRAPRRATAIKEERAKDKNALLLDAGDVFSGTLYFNVFEGLLDAEVMNIMKYDAMTIGNHEFDKGPATYAKFVNKLNFPVLSANVDMTKDKQLSKFVKQSVPTKPEGKSVYPAMIKVINGERVGVFGLTTEETAFLASPGPTIKFNNYIKSAQNTVDMLEEKGVNKIIALTHVGYDEDIVLAKAVEEIDVIVGGHSHTKVEKPLLVENKGDKTLVLQTDGSSKYLGKLNVTFDKVGDILTYDGGLLDVEEKVKKIGADGKEILDFKYVEDAEIRALLDKHSGEINKLKAQVIGKTDVALNGTRADVRTKETNLGNAMADSIVYGVQKVKPDVSIGFQNGGGVRASIDEGDITMGEVLT
ncbi:MAG: bifunctional metallophosphatase/5'-nucleotidase, partial [Bacilli bacterium]